jgi:autotransporter-associated beta strand protein
VAVRSQVEAGYVPPSPEHAAQLVADLHTGRGAHGIIAQSIGGGGGNGGHSVAIGTGVGGPKETWNVNSSMSVGGFGGSGGSGGRVDVGNHGSVTTRDDDSHAVLAQSVGGGGGNGGSAFTASIATGAANEGRSMNNSFSLGGFGGNGNLGGDLEVLNHGVLTTTGDNADGIRVQSVGGGGGSGGTARGMNLLLKAGSATLEKGHSAGANWKFQAQVGGFGGTGNHGGAVEVTNHGTVITRGTHSRGIFAQSVGGGGGSGGDGIKGTGTKFDTFSAVPFLLLESSGGAGVWGKKPLTLLRDWSFIVGGRAGSSGDGGAVRVDNMGSITTFDYGSTAIVAQSIGGGGGEAQGFGVSENEKASAASGGKAGAGAMGRFAIGGGGGAAGHGGTVDVLNHARLFTSGDAAHGIFAQSVGGGGGVAGNIERVRTPELGPLPAMNLGLGLDFGADGGSGGNGGAVTVASAGDIGTEGANAYGIFAQSVGGGGGLAGGIGTITEIIDRAFGLNFAGSVGGNGSGGAVTVTQAGTIRTLGVAADGIFAQSAGGQGLGGTVDITLNGNIFALGEGSNGILAQSSGIEGTGNITVTIDSGAVVGGSPGGDDITTAGAGVLILDGNSNRVTNRGTITTTAGVAGFAVRATGGNETLHNFGTLTGSVDLGTGTNALINAAGGLFESGATIQLGAGNAFSNSGLLSPGGAGLLQTSTLTGNLLHTGTPALLIDLGEIGQSDRLVVSGTASMGASRTTVDLNMSIIPAGNGAYTVVEATRGGLAGADFRFGTLFGSMPIGRTFELVNSDTREQVTLLPSSGAFYWRGAASNLWSSPFVNGESNWTRTAAPADFIYGTPGAATDVIFLSTGSRTALGADFSINSLTFAGSGDPAAVAIEGEHSLTIAAGGIAMERGSGDATVAVDVVLGADQQWSNESSSRFAVTGSRITGSGRQLTVGGSGATVIGSAIETGTGSLTKRGTGTLFLTGTNRYSGGTTVSAGVLVGNTGSLQGGIRNDAAVVFDQNGTGTYAGEMTGSGSLRKQGSGLLILSGANSYSGGTIAADGTLQGDTRSLQGDILNDAAVVFDQAGTGTYAGSMFGTGTLTKRGAGALTLSGPSGAFLGHTTVVQGQLFVDGTLGGGSLVVQRGTLLGGTGLVPSTTVQGGGMLSPGHSIGVLGAAGDVRFDGGSIYSVETEPGGAADRTMASGALTLAGGTVEVLAQGSEYLPISQYAIFSAGAGVGGTFAGATANRSFLNPSLQYGARDVFLTLRRNDVDFRPRARGGSALQVASVLNELVATATGSMADVINGVYVRSDGDAFLDMRSMGGAHYQHVASGSLADARTFMDANLTRLGRSARPADAVEPGTPIVNDVPGAAAAAHAGWLNGDARSGWWIRGLGGSTSLAGTAVDTGARMPTAGVVAGFDRALGRNLTLGISGARNTPEVRQEDVSDNTAARMVHFGVYGRYRAGASRIDAAAAFGRQRYRTQREVSDGNAVSLASASYDGDSSSAHVEYGHSVLVRGITLEAEGGVQYGKIAFDETAEGGADVLSLLVPARRVSSQRSLLGARASKPFELRRGSTLTIEGRAAWMHEFERRPAMAARFAGDTATAGFLIPSIGDSRDSAVAGAGAYLDMNRRVRLHGSVVSEISSALTAVTGSLGLGWRW